MPGWTSGSPQWRLETGFFPMKPLSLLLRACLLAGLVVLSGCVSSTITPQTAALKQVHDTYREEFLVIEGSPEQWRTAAASSSAAAFAKTLNAIQDYRANFPQAERELAHLTVLEGMAHLQAGRFGLAAAVEPDVVQAGELLKSAIPREKSQDANMPGTLVRDSLLAANYPDLRRGWAETRHPTNESVKVFNDAANGIVERLDQFVGNDRLAVQQDDGALYLATNAAIFYLWASSLEELQGALATEREKEEVRQRAAANRKKARESIGKFLTEDEKKPEIANDVAGVAYGRLRYIQWYNYLAPKIE
jgi:hypothetical protein